MFWNLEQALVWIMWRDESRLTGVGDGRPDILRPWTTAEIPLLSEEEKNEIVGWLLEHGDAHLVPAEGDPSRGRETRYGCHEASGCFPWIDVWWEHPGGPLRTDGKLHWCVPRREPLIGFEQAHAELLEALRGGKVACSGEDAAGFRVNLAPEHWLSAELRLSVDPARGGYMGHDLVPVLTGPSRLRFHTAETKAWWPPIGAATVDLPKRKRKLSGKAEGYKWRPDCINRIAAEMRAYEREGWSIADKDILIALEDISLEQVDGGVHSRTLKRWLAKVRARMEQLGSGAG